MLAAAGCIAPYFSWNEKAFANDAANDRPLIACIGLGGMGTGDAHELREFGDISAVCDVDANFAEAAKHDPNIGQGKSDVYQDYRKVLERNDVDVVSIVTPDHWHVKMAIEALQAGKHVFCQKPLTLTLEENQLIRNACNKYNKQIFVVGTQQRSDSEKFLRAVNMVQKGLLGDIHTITAGLAGAGAVGGPFAKLAPPAELNWDMWLGQAPKVDYIKERSHFQFRWWYEYSGGKFTDWGAHHVDIATWALGQDQLGLGPIEVDGSQAELPVPYKDGYPTVDDCFNTASEYVVTAKYANGATL
ncbi:MAG: Gfo/Idh/MocA family oxidoreductase, partial [Planctomycetota bacterium]|nr:Gfo/Idh/MocA family oxidoreductase [Planctomycetota bacterium]